MHMREVTSDPPVGGVVLTNDSETWFIRGELSRLEGVLPTKRSDLVEQVKRSKMVCWTFHYA
jgi:hypothetical protein